MKKTFKSIGALLLGAIIFISTPVSSMALDRSYTYNYDYWGDVQDCPDFYNVCHVFTASDLGMKDNFKAPTGMTVNGRYIYVSDTGNNRIVVLERDSEQTITFVENRTSYKKDGESVDFVGPTDVAFGEDGSIFVADKGSQQILKLDSNYNYLMSFTKPVDASIKDDANYNPDKIVVDTAGRVYCEASGINQGLVKYENDGTFSGFVGATPVAFDFWLYIRKKFATQAQRDQMVSFVPTEYSNIYMDKEGFIYATCNSFEEQDLKDEKVDAVRKLNLLGSNILVQNGEYPVYGDLYMGSGGGIEGPSRFVDVTVFDNDAYVCLDLNRGRLFGYNEQGNLLFAFGGNGNMDGYFRRPVALEHMGYDLLALDQQDCAITLFVTTEFGSLVYEAIDQFDNGEYSASGASWQKVMNQDGNYDLAYIGIGRALLREKKYDEAREYFELKYDDENYSKAFKQYRKEWVEDNIATIVIVVLALFLIPMIIGRVKDIRHEIDTADIFKYSKKED